MWSVIPFRHPRPTWERFLCVLGVLLLLGGILGHDPAPAGAKSRKQPKPVDPGPVALEAAKTYAEAVAVGDKAAAGRLDFACLYRLMTASPEGLTKLPADSDPAYASCWNQLLQEHQQAVEKREQVMDVIWPGRNSLVFFTADLKRYIPSSFFMELLGHSPPAGGLRVVPMDTTPLPAASFRLREHGKTYAVPTTRVRLRIEYKDPLLSPIAHAPGTVKWTNPIKRPRQAIKAVTVRLVVLSGLRQAGFPTDVAVLDLPVVRATAKTPAVPFTTESGGYEKDSAAWWDADDAPGVLLAGVGRAVLLPELRDRVAMLNRVLLVDPNQAEALSVLSRDLYRAILDAGMKNHGLPIPDGEVADRYAQLYWDIYAQTERTELSLGMEMGGLGAPTPADYLYRMIPAMERLLVVRSEDLETRVRLVTAYRWNNDQVPAIDAAQELYDRIPDTRPELKARALLELAWSRINRISWNREIDNPDIQRAYQEAGQAFAMTQRPVDRFVAAYAQAYSLLFMPTRDNQKMLAHLDDARNIFLRLDGGSPASWTYLLSNDNFKGVLNADPIFRPLFATEPASQDRGEGLEARGAGPEASRDRKGSGTTETP